MQHAHQQRPSPRSHVGLRRPPEMRPEHFQMTRPPARSQGVEVADDAVFHLRRRLIGKRHGQDVAIRRLTLLALAAEKHFEVLPRQRVRLARPGRCAINGQHTRTP